MGVKAKEFHALVRRELNPALGPLGFRRTRGTTWASWCRPVDDRWLVIWFQNSPHNGAIPGAAFEFTVEYQLGDAPIPGVGLDRVRVPALLTDSEREDMRARRNLVKARLPPPPGALIGAIDPHLIPFVQSVFAPDDTPYAEGSDIWFSQDGEPAVRMWTAWLRDLIPVTLGRFLDRAGLNMNQHAM